MKQKLPNNTHLFKSQSPLLVTTRVKVLLAFLVGLVLSLLVVYIARDQYMSSLINRTETISSLLDADRIESLKTRDTSAKENESYIKRQLQQARGANADVRFLYVMAISDANEVYFLVDSESSSSDSYSPLGQRYPEASEALKASFYTGRSFIEGPLRDRWGTWLSVISPVYDKQGAQIGVVGMDLPPRSYYTVLVTAVALPVLAAILVSVVFLATDTIRKRRQETVRMRSELVSIASHELRTPLTGIRWGEESLLQHKLQDNSRETVQTMYDSTLRLQESIEDILQLANWQAGRNQGLLKVSTDISAIFTGIFATQKLPAAQKHVSLEFDKHWPKQLMISCDAQRMKRVLNNLISNAIKYSTPGTAVIVSHQKVDGKHLISIKDTGIGIPADEQEKVFAGFYRASNAVSREASGTGMGLYMSRSAVEQHGGKLWLSSQQGKGTTVYIQLP